MARRNLLLLLLLALASLIVYMNGLKGEFLYDDRPYVAENPQVIEGKSVFLESTPPGRAHLGLYRPLFVLTLRWNYLAGGLYQQIGIHLKGFNLLFCKARAVADILLIAKYTA